MSETQSPAGWYEDPSFDATKAEGVVRLRFWDGSQWTDQLMEEKAPNNQNQQQGYGQVGVQTDLQQTQQSSYTQPDQQVTQRPGYVQPEQQASQQIGYVQPDAQQPYQAQQFAYQQASFQQPVYQQPSYPQQTPQQASINARAGGFAVASLVLGLVNLLGWCLPLLGYPVGIVGLILGCLGLKSEKKGMAIAGVVLCIVTLIATVGNSILGVYLQSYYQRYLY